MIVIKRYDKRYEGKYDLGNGRVLDFKLSYRKDYCDKIEVSENKGRSCTNLGWLSLEQINRWFSYRNINVVFEM